MAPFALVAPCTGVLASAIAFGEVPAPTRLVGMGLILMGLTVIVLPAHWLGARAAPRGGSP